MGLDILTGGRGSDTLVGGGDSILTGGEGVDLFVLGSLTGAATVVTDFDLKEDRLSLKNLGVASVSQLGFAQVDNDTKLTFNSQLIATLQGINAQLLQDDASTLLL